MHWIALICNVYTSNDAFYFESETDSFLLFQSSYAEDTFVYFKYPTLPYIIFYILYIYIYICFIIYIYIYIYWDICIHQSTLPVQCHSTFQFPMSPGSRLHTQPLLRKHISMAPWCYIPPTPSIATSTPPCAAFWMKESFRIRVAKLGMDILQGLDFWRYFSDDMVQTFFELDLLKILKWR